MILKSIRLENIRSYVSENIQFPAGSLMLSGDIGAGKSTILHAIEFALFGIRSDLKGEGLLRHGKDDGSVELDLSIDGKDVKIKRSLKRKNNSIQQEAGHIIMNGAKHDLTAVELKTKVLDMLGYPKELVSKSKSLVYRYTVYTPQEQMKGILFDDAEERLNTLRRVFGIDKYKRVIENTSIITKQLKSGMKVISGSIYDLEEKKRMVGERILEMKRSEKFSEELKPALESSKNDITIIKSSIERYERDIKELNELRTKLSAFDAQLNEKFLIHQRNTREIAQIDEQMTKLSESLGSLKTDVLEIAEGGIEKPKEDLRKGIIERKLNVERELNSMKMKINELEINKRNSAGIKDKISRLSNCPTCLQEVPETHKHNIVSREDDLQKKCDAEIFNLKKDLLVRDSEVKAMEVEIEKAITEEKNYEKQKVLLESGRRLLLEKEERKKMLLGMQDQTKKDIASINSVKIEINTMILGLAGSEEGYKKDKKLFDELKEKEKQIELKLMSHQKEAEGIRRIVSVLEKEIIDKEKAREKLSELSQLNEWLETSFVNLMTVIEKQIMAKVYEEFNGIFQQWFKVMVDDEALSITLDHDFAPVVQQDGYETFVENLSGGEKTAIALAYRLSLNKVINDMIGTIKTKDLIILDEPTDGFSSEQLDKVREVIEQLNMGQIIIVSHEQKVEGFVDSILRVEKRGHVSTVVA
jgi:exonuclease SbcC